VKPVLFTDETAAEAAETYAGVRTDGEVINRSDVYVAGTARSLGVSLVVSDDHFAAIEDVAVETYRDTSFLMTPDSVERHRFG
jgi:predicted nucleic acid-binding protein